MSELRDKLPPSPYFVDFLRDIPEDTGKYKYFTTTFYITYSAYDTETFYYIRENIVFNKVLYFYNEINLKLFFSLNIKQSFTQLLVVFTTTIM